MSTSKCSTCGEFGTPWTSTPELGTGFHMCQDCAFDYRDFKIGFNKYMNYLEHQAGDVNGDPLLQQIKPRTVKKMTYLLIKRWYNDRMKKK